MLPIAQWTVYHDEQDKLSGVYSSGLGPFGHFATASEYGLVGASTTNSLPLQDLPYRQTSLSYDEVAQDPNSARWKLWNIHRVKSRLTKDSAGTVLRRTAYSYTDDGRPLNQRAYFDPAGDPNAGNDEDILTEYVYSTTAPTTALLERSYVHRDGDPNSGFGSRYEYDPNTVMLMKSFVLNANNPTGSTSHAFDYASRELVRDLSSGAVIGSINPQGIRSDLYFDQLGRITKSTPDPNGIEFATYIQYPSIHETRVLRPADPNNATDPNSLGSNFNKTRYIYDALGRVIETHRRTETATSADCEAIQKTVYDVAGRAEFVSEWGFDSACDRSPFDGEQDYDPNSYAPASTDPNKNIGTRYLYYTDTSSSRVYD
ncbi:MAG TPA: hypothetical protein VE222_05185, partial [Nitrospiraceae bacterium]|nr:hypothetical protein [Nitrospiraceae bacterium]